METTNNTDRSGSLLNAADVARHLKISKAFAYQLLRRGEIKTVRLGRSVRVRPEDLENFIAKRLSGDKDILAGHEPDQHE